MQPKTLQHWQWISVALMAPNWVTELCFGMLLEKKYTELLNAEIDDLQLLWWGYGGDESAGHEVTINRLSHAKRVQFSWA